MAEENKKSSSNAKKVSPARHAVSLVLLLVAGMICVIELRAGLGQMLSSKALAAKANEGEFTDLPLKDARGMMMLAPKETVEDRGPDQVLKFEWYSLLRPLLQKSNPQITVIASNGSEPMALAFTTVEEEPEVAKPVSAETESRASSGMPASGPGAMSLGPGTPEKPPGFESEAETTAPASDTPAPEENSTPAESTPAETPEPAKDPEPAKE